MYVLRTRGIQQERNLLIDEAAASRGDNGGGVRPCEVSLSLSPTLFQAIAPFRHLCSSRSRRSSTTVGRSSGLCSSLPLSLPPTVLVLLALLTFSLVFSFIPSLALAFLDASNSGARVNAGRTTVLPRIAEVVSSKSRALDACLVILSTPARRTVLARRGRRVSPRGTAVKCTHGVAYRERETEIQTVTEGERQRQRGREREKGAGAA